MSSSLSELVLGWETEFRLESFVVHPEHYVRTFDAWSRALRAAAASADALVGSSTHRSFSRYFAASRALFRLRQQTLYRIVLSRRPEPKRWAIPAAARDRTADRRPEPRPRRFGRTTTSPTTSTGCGSGRRCRTRRACGPKRSSTDDDAQAAKVDFFASSLAVAGGRLLDVGCGWGAQLRPMIERHGAARGVGLTLSDAQRLWLEEAPVDTDHDPGAELGRPRPRPAL